MILFRRIHPGCSGVMWVRGVGWGVYEMPAEVNDRYTIPNKQVYNLNYLLLFNSFQIQIFHVIACQVKWESVNCTQNLSITLQQTLYVSNDSAAFVFGNIWWLSTITCSRSFKEVLEVVQKKQILMNTNKFCKYISKSFFET